MKPLFDGKGTLKERVSKLERVVTRLTRRQRKVATGIVTPFPISKYVENIEGISGDVLTYVFPCDGVIKSCIVKFKKKLKSPAFITISTDGESKSFIADRELNIGKSNIEVFSGTILRLRIEPDEESKEKITAAAVALLWAPTVSNSETKQFLIDELEKESERFNDEGV